MEDSTIIANTTPLAPKMRTLGKNTEFRMPVTSAAAAIRTKIAASVLFFQQRPEDQNIHQIADQMRQILVPQYVRKQADIRQRIQQARTIGAENVPYRAARRQTVDQQYRKTGCGVSQHYG